MKALLLSLILFLGVTTKAAADGWPYDQICRNHGATSETVKLYQPREQTIVLCKFGVGSFIERDTLDKTWVSGWEPYAVREYKNNRPTPFTDSCRRFGAWVYSGIGSGGQRYDICVFTDNSMMEDRTFSYGPTSGWNTEMDWALGIH